MEQPSMQDHRDLYNRRNVAQFRQSPDPPLTVEFKLSNGDS